MKPTCSTVEEHSSSGRFGKIGIFSGQFIFREHLATLSPINEVIASGLLSEFGGLLSLVNKSASAF